MLVLRTDRGRKHELLGVIGWKYKSKSEVSKFFSSILGWIDYFQELCCDEVGENESKLDKKYNF